MKRSQRLQPVRDFMARKEAEAARAMTEAARELAQAEERLEALQRFRREYAARMQRQDSVMNAGQLQAYRAFLANLGQAIEEQQTVLQQMRQQHAALERHWRQLHCRLRGVGKFQDRLRHEENRSRERRQQAELDDRSAARYRKTRAG